MNYKDPLVLEIIINISDKSIDYGIGEPSEIPMISGNVETTEQHLPQNNIDNLLLDIHSSIRNIIRERPRQ